MNTKPAEGTKNTKEKEGFARGRWPSACVLNFVFFVLLAGLVLE